MKSRVTSSQIVASFIDFRPLVTNLLLIALCLGPASTAVGQSTTIGKYRGAVYSAERYMPVVTTIYKNSRGDFAGYYEIQESASNSSSGTLSSYTPIGEFGAEFIWKDEYGSGKLRVLFSSNFEEFNGFWGTEDHANYRWSGSREFEKGGNAASQIPPAGEVRVAAKQPLPPNDINLQDIKDLADTIESVAGAANEMHQLMGSDSKVSADIVVESVSVASQKNCSEAWDVGGGEPDLSVGITIGLGILGASDETAEKSDTTYAAFNEKLVRVSEGDEITVTVYDNDFAAHDVIGTYKKTVTKEMLAQGSVDWSFDQVHSLKLKFEY